MSEAIETFVVCAFFFGVLYYCGVFRWVDHRINKAKPTADITPGDIAIIRSDIEKLKLALNIKEFKR